MVILFTNYPFNRHLLGWINHLSIFFIWLHKGLMFIWLINVIYFDCLSLKPPKKLLFTLLLFALLLIRYTLSNSFCFRWDEYFTPFLKINLILLFALVYLFCFIIISMTLNNWFSQFNLRVELFNSIIVSMQNLLRILTLIMCLLSSYKLL